MFADESIEYLVLSIKTMQNYPTMNTNTTQNQGGRPTKYDPKYCQLLLDHMAKGYSFETFVAVADVCRATLYNWLETYPDFKQAKEKAFARSLHYFETLAFDFLEKPQEHKGFHYGLWRFIMQNRFPAIYGDRKEKEGIVSPETKPVPVRESEIILSSGARIAI